MGDDQSGLAGLAGSADQVRASAGDLREDADAAIAAAQWIVDDVVDKAHAAVEQAVDAVHRLASGAGRLADGTSQLAAQAGPLADGIATAASGASDLASGNARLASGADTLADGAGDAATGSAQAADGAEALDEGLRALAQGVAQLRDGLVDGTGDVPRYTDDEARSLSDVAASPVTAGADRINEVDGYGSGLAPYFLSLALWVGAMSFYMMASAMSASALAERRPAWLVMLRSLVPGAAMGVVQAILAACVLHFWVGVDVANLPGVLGIAALASVTFMALNQALIALLGSPGRFIALLMIVLQLASAGGTYPVETAPAIYQWLHGALPITHTVEAFRSLIAGGGIGIGPVVGALAIWLGVALVLSLAASLIALRKERKDDDAAPAADRAPRSSGGAAPRPVAGHAAAGGSVAAAGTAATAVLDARPEEDAEPEASDAGSETGDQAEEARPEHVLVHEGENEEVRVSDALSVEREDGQVEAGDPPASDERDDAAEDDARAGGEGDVEAGAGSEPSGSRE